MLSLACDYRVMTDGSSRNAWLSMNEVRLVLLHVSCQFLTQRQVHFGAPWPLSFTAILRAKFGDHRLYRKIALEGHRYTAEEALQDGILDYIVKGKTADILAKAEEVADRFSGNATMGAWGLIKVLYLYLMSLLCIICPTDLIPVKFIPRCLDCDAKRY
jgi:Delta3-Delta2-enoyl-CoA isomerase